MLRTAASSALVWLRIWAGAAQSKMKIEPRTVRIVANLIKVDFI
jgi:hypothetical protein